MRRLAMFVALATLVTACGGVTQQEPEGSPPTSSEAGTSPLAPLPTTTAEAPPSKPRPRAGLPPYTAGYESWVQLNAKPIPPRESDPHVGTKTVYVSRPSRAGGVYRYGSIVVKEARRPGKDFVGLVAVMRKLRGADTAHGDWVFVEWTRERRSDPFTERASGAVCSSCHMGAADADYVWIAELGLTK